MTEWIAGNQKVLEDGTAVKLSKGETTIVGKWAVRVDGYVGVMVEGARMPVVIPMDEGWSLFVEAKPEPAIPTEVGAYVDKYGQDVWTVTTFHPMRCVANPSSSPAKYAPFTRLSPEADTARRVLMFMQDQMDRNPNGAHFAAARLHFGVTDL